MFTSATVLVFASILLLALLCKITSKSRLWRSSTKLPPGSYGWPVLGESLELLRAGRDGKPEKFIQERMDKYDSRVFKTSLLGEKMVVFCGPAGHKFIFGNDHKLVTQWWPKSTQVLLKLSLAVLVGNEAKRIRKTLMSFLNLDSKVRYIRTMDLITQHHIKTRWEGVDEITVYPAVKLQTFELACRLFLGIEDPKDVSYLADHFYVLLKGVISLAFNFPGTRFYNSRKATEAIEKKLKMIARQRKIDLEQKIKPASDDLLSYLLVNPDENGKFFTEEEIVSNLLNILIAGHDTTSSTIAVIMKYLAELPQVYEGVLREQMDIASSKEKGELLGWEDLQKMKYTWNVVCEVMRLTPPIIGSFREAIVDINYEGYTIPKGFKIYWTPISSHRDPSYFPNETKFDPSRFEGGGPAPYSFVPFGGGPRMCLGQEFARLQILVFLHNVVKRFKWQTQIPDEKIEFDPMPVPVKGLPVHLQSHNNCLLDTHLALQQSTAYREDSSYSSATK